LQDFPKSSPSLKKFPALFHEGNFFEGFGLLLIAMLLGFAQIEISPSGLLAFPSFSHIAFLSPFPALLVASNSQPFDFSLSLTSQKKNRKEMLRTSYNKG
jgi:hypothetical protein